MSKPDCLGCIWFSYSIPYCNCPNDPPECECEQTTVSAADNKEIKNDCTRIDRSIISSHT